MAENSNKRLHFGAMLGEIGAEAFFSRYWQKQTLSVPMQKDSFETLLQEIGPLDIPRCCELAREGARAWLANDFVAHSVIAVDASNAERFFAVGATLYFLNVRMESVTDALADFLGAPRRKIIASLFLTPSGGGAVAHFDKNENFTVQLTGTKEWVVDNKPAVVAPYDGYVLGQTIPASLRESLPLSENRASQSVSLRAGMLLYVPRGTVHRTSAGTVSWSLNLSYSPSSWMDLLLVALKHRLAKSDQWRATVTGIGRVCDPSASAANVFPNLIAELQSSFSDPDELARMTRDFLENPDG